MKVTKLNIKDIFELENRLFKIKMGKFNNNNPKGKTLRPILVLLREKELYKLLMEKENSKNGNGNNKQKSNNRTFKTLK